MVTFNELSERVKFWLTADRLGQDMPLTYWRLFFKSEMKRVCKKKFGAFGEGSDFRPGAYAEACSKIFIGENVVIRSGSFLFADPTPNGGTITIESNVLIGPGVHMYTNNHEFSNPTVPIIAQGYPLPSASDSIRIHKGCWIGAGAIILPGVEVGENAVIGAGSVVTKSVPSHSVSVGIPARVIKHLEVI